MSGPCGRRMDGGEGEGRDFSRDPVPRRDPATRRSPCTGPRRPAQAPHRRQPPAETALKLQLTKSVCAGAAPAERLGSPSPATCSDATCQRGRTPGGHAPHAPTPLRSRAAHVPARPGHLALTLRFPLVRCLFFPPMAAFSPHSQPQPPVETAGPQLPALLPEVVHGRTPPALPFRHLPTPLAAPLQLWAPAEGQTPIRHRVTIRATPV